MQESAIHHLSPGRSLPGVMLCFLAATLFCGCATPLQNAARIGNTAEMQRLLGQGADINEQNAAGITALMEAANYGHVECVRLLLNSNADINVQYSGWTALTFAKQNGYTEIINLLENASRERVEKQARQEALQMAERMRNTPLVQLLETREFSREMFIIALTDKLIDVKNCELPGFIVQSTVDQRIVLLNAVEKALINAQAQLSVFNSQAADAVRKGQEASEFRKSAARIQAFMSVLLEIKNMLMQS